MVGSFNGLVCLQSYGTKNIPSGICNPLTGEFLCLPGLTERRDSAWQEVGFGYIPSTNEYKVVRIRAHGVCARQGQVEVYTLGSQSGWRAKEIIPYEFDSSGIFANGAIHWVGERGRQAQHVYQIVAFDLADEKVKYVSLPPFNYAKGLDSFRLMLLGVNLCVIHYRVRDRIQDIWALTRRPTRILRPRVTRGEYYDHSWSWNKDFSIAINHSEEMYDYKPFTVTKNNEVLLWHQHNKQLYFYDNNTSTLTKLRDGGGDGLSCIQVIHHMNSLVSLKDLGDNSLTVRSKRRSVEKWL